jgi:hypothetical protein
MCAAPGAGRARLILLQDPALNPGVKEQIHALGSRFSIERIVELVESNFQVKVSREQIFALRAERCAPHKQAAPATDEGRPDKESVQIAADAEPESIITFAPEPAPPPFSVASDAAPTRTGPGQEQDSPEPIAAAAPPHAQADTPPTRTGPGQEKDAPEPIAAGAPPHAQVDMPPTRTEPGLETESLEILPTEVREFVIGQMAQSTPPWLIASQVRRDFGFEVDHDEIIVCWRDRDALMAQTGPGGGPGHEKVSRPKLSDEVKEFIVKRIACYETPSRIAAAVRINFAIDIDRRRIFDYNPKGSRPPAQRWIDLHDATRARFLREVSEIGVAQKVIRLKMLDRFAEMAEDNHQHDKAAKYLQQAARECGGFYEKHRAPQAAKSAAC